MASINTSTMPTPVPARIAVARVAPGGPILTASKPKLPRSLHRFFLAILPENKTCISIWHVRIWGMEMQENGNNAVKQESKAFSKAVEERMRRQDLNPFACIGLSALALRGGEVKRVLETGFGGANSYGHL